MVLTGLGFWVFLAFGSCIPPGFCVDLKCIYTGGFISTQAEVTHENRTVIWPRGSYPPQGHPAGEYMLTQQSERKVKEVGQAAKEA